MLCDFCLCQAALQACVCLPVVSVCMCACECQRHMGTASDCLPSGPCVEGKKNRPDLPVTFHILFNL